MTIRVRQSSTFHKKFSLRISSDSAGEPPFLSESSIPQFLRSVKYNVLIKVSVNSQWLLISWPSLPLAHILGLAVFVPLSLMPSQNSALHELSQEIHFHQHFVNFSRLR